MPNDECRMNDEIRMTRRASRSPVRHLSIPAYFVIRHPSLVIHNHNLRSRTPFDATMLYLSFICSSGRRSTVPPAFSTKPAGCDVPQANSRFNVRIHSSTGDVSHVERSTAEHAALAHAMNHGLKQREIRVDRLA